MSTRTFNFSSLESGRNVLGLTQPLHEGPFSEVFTLLIISLPIWTYKGMNLLTQRNVPGNNKVKTKWAGRARSKVLPSVSESHQGRETVMGSNWHQHQSWLFLKNIFIYLFIWLHRVLVVAGGLLGCGTWTLSCGMHVGSSSLTRDWTWAPCIGSAESYPLHHQGSPSHDMLTFSYVALWEGEKLFSTLEDIKENPVTHTLIKTN